MRIKEQETCLTLQEYNDDGDDDDDILNFKLKYIPKHTLNLVQNRTEIFSSFSIIGDSLSQIFERST